VATERLFGLDWTGVPRYMTGVPLERVEPTRNALFAIQGVEPPSRAPQMEEMFTIRIRAGKDAILRQLGAFGDPDRQYLKPRFLRISRVAGAPNQVGTVIRYNVPLVRLSFSMGLEKVEPGRYLLYRIVEGMGKGGILAFTLDELRPGVNLLTIYVGFDFPKNSIQHDASPSGCDRREGAKDAGSVRSSATDATEDEGSFRLARTRRPGRHSETSSKGSGLGRIKWAIGRRIFPQFAHNVVWNHALCQIRHLAEMDEG
jgi:hypothetical protein